MAPKLANLSLARKKTPSPLTPNPVGLDVILASPSIALRGTPATSTGAVCSGQVRVANSNITGQISLRSLRLSLIQTIADKQPSTKRCAECMTRSTVLQSAKLVTNPVSLEPGKLDFPFVFPVAGDIPASVSSTAGTVTYHLAVHGATAEQSDVTFSKPVSVKRSLDTTDMTRSFRKFPETSIMARAQYHPVVSPGRAFPVHLALFDPARTADMDEPSWLLRRVKWKMVERQKMFSHPCSKHAGKHGDQNPSPARESSRTIARGELKLGKGRPIRASSGNSIVNFDIAADTDQKPNCDVNDPGNIQVQHTLVIEAVVEAPPSNRMKNIMEPTNTLKLLGMELQVTVADDSSTPDTWSTAEVPPSYIEIPSGPPQYGAPALPSPRICEIAPNIEVS